MAVPTLTCRVGFPRVKALEDLIVGYDPSGGYWRFDETSGSILFDRIRGNHGTFAGGYTQSSASLLFDDSATDTKFNGTTGYATIADANSLDVADTFSVGGVIKLAATGVKQYLIARGATAFGVYVDTDNKLKLEKQGTGLICLSTSTLDTSAHSWLITKTGASVVIYIDGLDVTGAITNQTCAATATAMFIGQDGSSANWSSATFGDLWLDGAVWSSVRAAAVHVSFATGETGGTSNSIVSRMLDFAFRNGRNSDRTGDAVGTATFRARNETGFFSDERNLAPNPSAEFGLHDFDGTAIASVIAAGTSIAWRADPATSAGSYCAEFSLSSTLNSGYSFPIEGFFPANQPVTIAVDFKSSSGNTNIVVGIASSGTPADIALSTGTITGAFATKTATLTPSADRTDLVGFIRTSTAAVAVVRADKFQVNRGSSANTWLDGPTWPMLQPGARFVFIATYSGTDYPMFSGHVDDINEIPYKPGTAELQVTDAFGDLSIPIDLATTNAAHYTTRYGILDAAIRKIVGSVENLCLNGDFETTTVQWQLTTGAARSNAVTASNGSWQLLIPGNATATYTSPAHIQTLIVPGRYYTCRVRVRLVSAADTLTIQFGDVFAGSYTSTTASPTTSYATYSVPWLAPSTLPPQAGSIKLSWSSADSTKGGYVDEVMIVEGLAIPASYVDYARPTGRLRNYANAWQATENAALFAQGWGNRCTNPEAATVTTGWGTWQGPQWYAIDVPTGTPTAPSTQEVSGWQDTDTQTYTTNSVRGLNNFLYLAWIENSHATNAATVTLAGMGLTWVSVATRQFSGTTRRLTLFRALLAAAVTTGTVTVTVSGTNNTGCGWQIHSFTGIDTSGTNGSGAIQQSSAADSTTAKTAYTLTGLAAGTQVGNMVACGFASDVNTPLTASSSAFATHPWKGGTAPTGALTVIRSDLALTNPAITASASGVICGIGVEIKGVAGGTLTRVTTGGYAGGFSTAFSIAALTGVTVEYVIAGTFRSGNSYNLSAFFDTLPVATTSTGTRPAVYRVTAMSLAGNDSATNYVSGPLVHGTGARLSVTFTPSADRTDVRLVLKNTTADSAALTWSGVMVKPGSALINYARTGLTSPSTLDECSSITSAATGVSHSHCTQFTTYATAGSGIAMLIPGYQAFTGGSLTVLLSLKVSAGTPAMAITLGNPFGAKAADQATLTYTASTSFQRLWLKYTPATNDFTSGNVVVLSIMVTTATAVTVSVDDVSVTMGTAVQAYVPSIAAGIDKADIDTVSSVALVGADALSTLGAMNDSQARHWMEPLAKRPWDKYKTRARQSLATLAVTRTFAEGTMRDVPSLRRNRSETIQEVVVNSGNTLNPIFASTTAAKSYVDRIGRAQRLTLNNTWLNATSAQTVTDLLISRRKVARALPTFVLRAGNAKEGNFANLVATAPDDRLAVTSSRALIAGRSYQVLARTIAIAQGADWTGSYESEEYQPS